jgi:hypothetical protein
MEALFTAITVPIWAAAIGVLAVVIVVISVFRGRAGHEPHGTLSVLTQVALVAVIGGAAYLGLRHLEGMSRRAERNALEDRAAALLARASQPGSVLACVDGTSEPALAEACERTLFAEPQRVAAALAHVRERLLFVTDAVAYAEARDASYLDRVREFRDSIETDAYGFVAHVMATDDKCTAEACTRFRILRDPAKVKDNLAAKRMEGLVGKHAAAWREPEKPAPPKPVVAPAPEPESVPTPPAAATPTPTPPATVAPARPGAAPKSQPRTKDKDKAGAQPRAGTPNSPGPNIPPGAATRRTPEPVAGLPRVVPRRYLEQEEEDKTPPQTNAPGTPPPPAGTPPATALPPPTAISPPRPN